MRARVAAASLVAAGAATAILLAGTAAATVSGGAKAHPVKAPAVGKVLTERFTVKLGHPTGKVGTKPLVKVANLKQLGKGFGGVAVVQSPKKLKAGALVTVTLVMYMGNNSASPPPTAEIEVIGEQYGEEEFSVVRDITKSCLWKKEYGQRFENGLHYEEGDTSLDLENLVDTPGASEPEAFLDNIISFSWGNCPGKPEPFDPGNK